MFLFLVGWSAFFFFFFGNGPENSVPNQLKDNPIAKVVGTSTHCAKLALSRP
jgi:hypothetical protein